MISIPVNKLLVQIEQKYSDKIDGIEINTFYNPQEYATLKGKVVSVPQRVDKAYWKTNVEQLAKVGDEIWFSYGVVYDYKRYKNTETPVYKNLIEHEGEEYWKVDYSEVFCIVRNGEIIIPTQTVLLEPVLNETEEVLASGLILQREHEVHQDRGRIKAIGTTDISCGVGDIVPLDRSYIQQYIIFDELHYIVPIRRLIAKF